MNNKLALIFGITGQDGAYLADFLLKKNLKLSALQEIYQKKILLDFLN